MHREPGPPGGAFCVFCSLRRLRLGGHRLGPLPRCCRNACVAARLGVGSADELSLQEAEEYRRYLDARTRVPYPNSLDGPVLLPEPPAVPIAKLRDALAELGSFQVTVSLAGRRRRRGAVSS